MKGLFFMPIIRSLNRVEAELLKHGPYFDLMVRGSVKGDIGKKVLQIQ
jgi:hypothetical protein